MELEAGHKNFKGPTHPHCPKYNSGKLRSQGLEHAVRAWMVVAMVVPS